ncbi:protein adenylyltransferase SelO [Vibrio gangliei]|uniref:protein adenylyltransferase SelO n=1 Tax=Vibrio gangliei TaxID=2077090 RepID=UPI000D014DE9|nr:YdiU family protein [Vibrio gangliei]
MSSWSSAQFSYHFHGLSAGFYQAVSPTSLDQPHWVHWNSELAQALSLPSDPETDLLTAFSGQSQPDVFRPIAMKYAGHQFGYYNPDLGDGRGLLLAEIHSKQGLRYDIHIKGAGLTPFSRQGDGRAVLRSSIREYLCSEALFHLGIPTTRALGLINSTTPVYREKTETGAICIRLAESHIRFGHFEHCFYTGQHEQLQELLDYTLLNHYPDCQNQEKPYVAMLEQVVIRTAQLFAKWNAFGFAHGVLNTDNMSILGQTFDFGPFGFLDNYNPSFICNHSDYQGRYSFANQPNIGLWNLTALAHALSPYIERADLDAALSLYEPELNQEFSRLMRQKTGLISHHENDSVLFGEMFSLLAKNKVDYTRFFRQLSMLDKQGIQPVIDLILDREAAQEWLDKYLQRLTLETESDEQRCQAMRRCNPKYILRNHLAQIAIDKAENGDYTEVERLFSLLQTPYDEQPELDHYANLPPSWAHELEISCSS